MLNRLDHFRKFASVFAILAGMAAAGCEGPPVGAIDYKIQYPVSAEEKVFSLIVPVSASGRETTAVRLQRIRLFAAGYLRRSRGPLLVSHGRGVVAFNKDKSKITHVLVKAGVPRNMIFFQTRSKKYPGRNTTELSYSGYTIRVPSCGDWSGQAGFDPSNRSHTDFGCSYQRNTGLMIANPGDLSVHGGPVERDTQTSDRVIRSFRDGKVIGTPAPILEQKEFSDVK